MNSLTSTTSATSTLMWEKCENLGTVWRIFKYIRIFEYFLTHSGYLNMNVEIYNSEYIQMYNIRILIQMKPFPLSEALFQAALCRLKSKDTQRFELKGEKLFIITMYFRNIRIF